MNPRQNYQLGAIDGKVIAIVLLALSFAGALIFGVWAFLQYDDYKSNFDSKVEIRSAEIEKEQAEAYEKKLLESEKEPNRQFVGPTDYGRVTFDYPKTWSVYEATDVSGRSSVYQAYLHPVVVPPISQDQKFAVRVTIENKGIDEVLSSYESQVGKGELRSSSISVNGVAGTRLDGKFNETLRGAAVLFKIRDKTLTIRTDADTFKSDFDKLVQTINFNQ